ncbi:MAG: ATP-binding protein, partial [Myxococcota bacterium]
MTEKREAETRPSKSFFVTMLTRDIDLRDAILDLLDNCIDGAVRSGVATGDEHRPYAGYWARLSLSGEQFLLEDNCGGIPIGAARNRAFRLGRPPEAAPAGGDGKTVGVYGIGMKRAIFKLGRNARIASTG